MFFFQQAVHRNSIVIAHVTMATAIFLCFFLFLRPANAELWENVDQDIAVTALGHRAAVSCHNCYNGPGNEIYELDDANEKISNAVENGADLIELDLREGGDNDEICVTHDSSENPCTKKEPWLEDILKNPTLKNSNAMLFLELKGLKSSQNRFAYKLLDLLLNGFDRHYTRSGRFVFIRAFAGRTAYLTKMRIVLMNDKKYEGIRKYIKFSVLYNAKVNGVYWGGKGSIAELQRAIYNDVHRRGFNMVELHFRMKDILGALTYAKSLGLSTGVFTIPARSGEVYIAAMREDVDQLTTEYRVDHAKSAISAVNTLAYANVWPCDSKHEAYYQYNYTGSPKTEFVDLYVHPSSDAYGSPGQHEDVAGQDRFGCSLDFRVNQGFASRAFPMGDRDNDASAGFLVTAYVNFEKLSNLPEGTMALLNKSESGGFALELHRSGEKVYLRFGVHVNGKYRYHSYNVKDTNFGGINGRLNGQDGYFLIGTYDGHGGVYLWIDNDRRGWGGSYTGGVTQNSASILAGADPQPSAPQKARFFFDGLLQQVSVQKWDDHPTGAN